MSPIIQARELSHFYGLVLGLNNVSFDLGPGMTGLVGPNGAGKSTLIKLLTGQLRPSSGTLTVFGQTPWNNPAALATLGYCPEHEHVHTALRPLAWLHSLALLSGLSSTEARARAEETLDRVQLSRAHWTKTIGTYSKGMRQRVKLAQALLHRPRLILLDEPMNGLDPMGRDEVHRILHDLHRDGTHILISSHILPELEMLCGNFLLINWGRVLATGTQAQIRQSLSQRSEKITLRTRQPQVLIDYLRPLVALKGYLLEPDAVQLWLQNPEAFHATWPDTLAASPAEILEIQTEDQSLAHLFEAATQ